MRRHVADVATQGLKYLLSLFFKVILMGSKPVWSMMPRKVESLPGFCNDFCKARTFPLPEGCKDGTGMSWALKTCLECILKTASNQASRRDDGLYFLPAGVAREGWDPQAVDSAMQPSRVGDVYVS